jgi:hypothetical protein
MVESSFLPPLLVLAIVSAHALVSELQIRSERLVWKGGPSYRGLPSPQALPAVGEGGLIQMIASKQLSNKRSRSASNTKILRGAKAKVG